MATCARDTCKTSGSSGHDFSDVSNHFKMYTVGQALTALATQMRAFRTDLDRSPRFMQIPTVLSGETMAGQKNRRKRNDERARLVCLGNRCRTISRKCMHICPIEPGQECADDSKLSKKLHRIPPDNEVVATLSFDFPPFQTRRISTASRTLVISGSMNTEDTRSQPRQ